MGIASFSPSLSLSQSRFESPALSLMLAPVRAIASFFMPAQIVHNSHAVYRHAPAAHLANGVMKDVMGDVTCHATKHATRHAINEAKNNSVKPTVVAENFRVAAVNETKTPCVSRLKVMREFEPGLKRSQVGRMAICGRMADVCAELDRIASKAASNP